MRARPRAAHAEEKGALARVVLVLMASVPGALIRVVVVRDAVVLPALAQVDLVLAAPVAVACGAVPRRMRWAAATCTSA